MPTIESLCSSGAFGLPGGAEILILLAIIGVPVAIIIVVVLALRGGGRNRDE